MSIGNSPQKVSYDLAAEFRNKYETGGQYERIRLWEMKLPEIVDNYIKLVAVKTGEDDEELRERYNNTQNIHVYIDRASKAKQTGGYDSLAQVITISSGWHPAELMQTLYHETGHALLVNNYEQPTYILSDTASVQNGLHTTHIDFDGKLPKDFKVQNHAEWLNEGFVDVATQAAKPDYYVPGYITGAVLISSLFEVQPILEKEMYMSAFITGNKCAVIGLIEEETYPLWVEEIAPHIDYMQHNVPGGSYDPIREISRTLTQTQLELANKYYKLFTTKV